MTVVRIDNYEEAELLFFFLLYFWVVYLLSFVFLLFPFFAAWLLPRKGSRIKNSGSTFKGEGWLDNSKDSTADYTYVIYNRKGKHGKITEVHSYVKHENYLLWTEIKDATNYEESMVHQHSDIDQLLNKLVRKMAECELVGGKGTSSAKNISNILVDRLDKAVARQSVKGNGARWCSVKWSA